MKKLAIFIFVALLAIFPLSLHRDDIFEMPGIDKVTFLTDSVNALGEEFLPSGNDAILQVEKNQAKQKFKILQPKCVVFELKNTSKEDIIDFLNLKFISAQTLDNMSIIYGWTNKFLDYNMVNGKKVNVQIVIENNSTLVGFPMIMTGF